MTGVELKKQPFVRETWYDAIGPVRVMAIADGWMMARRPRCCPFVTYITHWHERFQDAPRGAADDGGNKNEDQT